MSSYYEGFRDDTALPYSDLDKQVAVWGDEQALQHRLHETAQLASRMSMDNLDVRREQPDSPIHSEAGALRGYVPLAEAEGTET